MTAIRHLGFVGASARTTKVYSHVL